MTVTPPAKIFSFTDFAVANPTSPPPGDRIDAQFVEHKRAIDDTITALEGILRSDGALKNGSVTEDTLAPGLAASLAASASAVIAPDVAAAQSASTAAQTAKTDVDAKAATVSSQAAQVATQHAAVMGAAGTALADANDAVSAIALQMAALGTVQTFISNAENDALGAAATAQEWAEVSVAWAEHMPGTIPPNILAIMGVTGDHWSSRWWANRAAQDVTSILDAADRAEAAATAAEAAQAAAQTAEANTRAVYDDFDDRYLGPKAVAPVLDNDGDPLETGALYFNTTIHQMLVWNGASWQSFAGSTIAADVAFTPTGSIAATNVQAALAEVATEYAAADTATLNSAKSYADGLDAAQKTYIDGADANLQSQIDTHTADIATAQGTANTALANAATAQTTANGKVSKVGDTMTGLLRVNVPNDQSGILVAGATKGVRILPSANVTAIEGVDQTGVTSYQPLRVQGSTLTLAGPTTISDPATALGGITIQQNGAELQFRDTSAAADRKRSRFVVSAGSTYLQALTDAGGFLSQGFQYDHATGRMTMSVRPLFGAATPWDGLNFPMDITTVAPTTGDAPVWDGTKFVPGLSGGAVVSDTPPTFKPGSLWWESDTGAMFIGYRDANSDQWVQTNANTGVPDAPVDGQFYARRNAAWEAVNPAGQLGEFFRTTAPAGWLKANGAAVSLTAYSRLIDIYCGNTDNATALFGYRCTDPLNPTTSRSTTGGYIVLPDARGEFRRGFDDGRGIDSGRNMWLAQAGLVAAHTHGVTDPGHTHVPTWTDGNGFTLNAGGGVYRFPFTSDGGAGYLTTTSNVTGISIQANAGAENRPRNLAPLVCIRY